MNCLVKNRNVVWFIATCVVSIQSPAATFGGLVPQSHPLFDGDAVHEIRLTFSQADWWDRLVANFEGLDDPLYLEAAFDWGDVHFDSIGVRFKGNSSYNSYPGVKKSFKLDIDEYVAGQEIYGLDKLNLNNCFLDPSYVRERCCYELCEAVGLPTVRTNYAALYINDTYWGLYVLVEQFDQEFIERRFGAEEEGNLWKGEPYGTLEYLGASESLYYDDYELKTNEDQNDWSGLVDLIDVINNTAIGDLQDALHNTVDVNSAMAMLAIDNFTVNLDSYIGRCANYYFYHRELDGRFVFANWDVNESWGVFNYNMSVNQLRQLSPFWTNPRPNEERPLAERLWQVQDYEDIYLGHMKKLMAGAAEPDTLVARMEELRDLVRTYVYADTNKMFTNAEFEAAMSSNVYEGPRAIPALEPFIRERDSWLRSQIGTWTAIEGLAINEVMASNDSTIADEYGDYDDWIEIVNVGSAPVDLTGLGLVDHMDGSEGFVFPSITLDPGEYVLVWADEEPGEGSLHAPFKLDGDGEDVYLTDGAVIIDLVTFPSLASDLSFGRYANGDGDWGYMDPATPGEANGPHNTPPEIVGTVHTPTAPTAAEVVWVTCTATDDGSLSGVLITYDAGGGPVGVSMCDDGAHGDGVAGDGVYGGQVPAFAQDTEVNYYVSAVDSFGAETTDPSGAPDDAYTYIVGYALPTIYINEFMADNDGVIQDEAGDYDDWFELYNAGGTTLDLGGMYLTDDLTDPTQWQIAAGTTIPAGGHLLFWADDEESEGSTHTNFKLGKGGEQIGLYDADANGNVLIETVTFGQQSTDISFGRYADGDACWRFFMAATPGDFNVLPHAAFDSEPDGDVDLDDYVSFSDCMTGPGGLAGVGCEVFDSDCDGDVDVADFAGFQQGFTGP